ncbi:UNVERIFIED_CONTAM: hypothetical protein HDU68_007662 [Siphonaria sp. JEL0065]|nr:hypothetical protein HDU68_007662 [Siphonaria sp. JEL0065]
MANITTSHPIGCSDPPFDATRYYVNIENHLTLPLVFNFVDSTCVDSILPSTNTSTPGMPQVIEPGASQPIRMLPGSVIVALQAINNGQSYGHVVAAYRSGGVNSTWSITTDLNGSSSSGPNVGGIVGGVVGGLLAIALLVGGVIYWRKRKSAAEFKSYVAPTPITKTNTTPRRTGTTPATVDIGVPAYNSPVTIPAPAAGTANSLNRPLPNRTNTGNSLPRRPSNPNGNAVNNNSLGRPVPTRSNTATPNSDSLGRRGTNTPNNNSLGRPLPGSKLTGAAATIPAVPPISNSLNRTPSNKVATPKIEDESSYYQSEPVDPTAPGSRLRLKHPHTPAMDDELRLNKGDIVEMVEVFEDGWCHARVVMSGLRGVTRRGDEGMLPVGCLEIAAPAGQQRVLKNVRTPTAAKAQYAGNWDEYTRQKKRTSSLYSTGAY